MIPLRFVGLHIKTLLLGINVWEISGHPRDHDKGQKSAISGRHLHFLQWIFSFFSRFCVYFSQEITTKCGEIARFPGGKNA